MNMVRYDPFMNVGQLPSAIGQLQSEINRLFSNWADTESSGATAGWVPTVDIHAWKRQPVASSSSCLLT